MGRGREPIGWLAAAAAVAVAGALSIAGLVGLACSSSSSGVASGAACGSGLAACPAGTTCWPANSNAELECLAVEKNGSFGAACHQTIAYPTCGFGLGCDEQGPEAGVCTYYCGTDAQACPSGYACYVTAVGSVSGPTVEVCRKPPPADEGGVLDGGVGDASTDVFMIPLPTSDGGSAGPPGQQ